MSAGFGGKWTKKKKKKRSKIVSKSRVSESLSPTHQYG